MIDVERGVSKRNRNGRRELSSSVWQFMSTESIYLFLGKKYEYFNPSFLSNAESMTYV